MPPREVKELENDVLQQLTGDEDNPLGGDDDNNDDDDDFGNNERRATNDVADGDDGDDNDKSIRRQQNKDEPQERQQRQPDDRQQQQRTTDDVDDDDEYHLQADAQGNLIGKDGRVLFKAGTQRNQYVRLRKAYLKQRDGNKALARHTNEITKAGRALFTKFKELQGSQGYPQTKGLTQQEHTEAVDIMALAKTDPKGAVRKILTKLHLAGTDLSEMGVTTPLDATEVAKQVLLLQKEERNRERELQRNDVRNEAKAEIKTFFANHPEAQRHMGPLIQAKRDFPEMTLEQIWENATKYGRQRRSKPDTRREITRDQPRNSSRGGNNGQLSLNAVDPSQSFRQIGKDLLRDIQALEGK